VIQHIYRTGSRQVAIAVERSGPGRYTVTVDGHRHVVEAALRGPSTLQLVVDGRQHTAWIVRIGDAEHVAVDGEVHVLRPEVAGSAAAGDHSTLAPPQIVAPMPGKVLHVLVTAGAQVAAGDGLLILEAMKMEHRIIAEAAATVRAVHVSDGQMVDGGSIMLELEYE